MCPFMGSPPQGHQCDARVYDRVYMRIYVCSFLYLQCVVLCYAVVRYFSISTRVSVEVSFYSTSVLKCCNTGLWRQIIVSWNTHNTYVHNGCVH